MISEENIHSHILISDLLQSSALSSAVLLQVPILIFCRSRAIHVFIIVDSLSELHPPSRPYRVQHYSVVLFGNIKAWATAVFEVLCAQLQAVYTDNTLTLNIFCRPLRQNKQRRRRNHSC